MVEAECLTSWKTSLAFSSNLRLRGPRRIEWRAVRCSCYWQPKAWRWSRCRCWGQHRTWPIWPRTIQRSCHRETELWCSPRSKKPAPGLAPVPAIQTDRPVISNQLISTYLLYLTCNRFNCDYSALMRVEIIGNLFEISRDLRGLFWDYTK